MTLPTSHTKKHRIIFSSYDEIHNPYYGGGGAWAVHEVAKRLSKDFSVTVIVGNYKGARDGVVKGVRYQHIGFAFTGPKLSQLLYHFFLFRALRRETFTIWIESFTPPFSTSYLQLFTKKPVIGLVHMLSAQDMWRKYHLPLQLVEKAGLRQYRYFIVLTKTIQTKIRRLNSAAKIFLVPNGMDPVRIPKRTYKDRGYLLYLGRVEVNQKGLDLLLESYKVFRKNSQEQLIIAGNGARQEVVRLKTLIAKHKLQQEVRLTGWVSGKEKVQLLRNCSAVVIPSRFETFSTVALEAMSYGKPIISFAIDGLHWIPNSCIRKAKPFYTTSLAKHIKAVLADENLRRVMGEAATKEVVRYSWDTASQGYREAILTTL